MPINSFSIYSFVNPQIV